MTDGLLSANGRVNITVGEGNRAPVAANDALSTSEDQALVFNAADLLANDTDADGDTLTITLGAAQNGTVSETAPGVYRFTPNANFNGNASFAYTISDALGAQSQAVVTISVSPVNDAPAPAADSVTTDEDTTIRVRFSTLLANDLDVDGDTLRIVAFSNATDGSIGDLCFPCGRVDFVPDANFNGVAGFDYTVEDAAGAQRTAHVTVTVNAVNDAPRAVDDSVNVLGNGLVEINPASLTANDTDVENNPLSVTAVSNPLNGTVALVDGTIRFQPSAGFFGVAGFDVTISDGAGGTATSHVTVNVTQVNAAPVAVDDLITLRFGQPLRITAAMLTGNDTDADGDVLTLVSLSAPSLGTLSPQADGSYIFNAPALSSADVTMAYTVSDGRGGTDTGTLTIRPRANLAPTVAVTSASTLEDTSLVVSIASLLANAADADGDSLSLSSVRAQNGTALIDRAAGTVTFKPNTNFNGAAKLYYSVSDGRVSTEGRVDIAVSPVNDAPVAGTVSLNGRLGQTLRIDPATLLARASDPDGDALTVTAVSPRFGGTVSIEAGTGFILFTPTSVGATSFFFTVSDGNLSTTAAAAVSVPLMAVADTVTTSRNTPIVLSVATLLANDVGAAGDAISFVGVSGASNGSISYDAAAGTVTFTPNPGFTGRADFRYTATFGGISSTAAVVVQVTNSDAPQAVADTVRTVAGQPVQIDPATLLANDTHAPGTTLTLTAVGNAANGTVVLNGGMITFTPDAGFTGTASFTYTVTSGGTPATGQVRVAVGANAAPVFAGREFTTAEDTSLVLSEATLASAFRDPEGAALSVISVGAPVGGTVSFDPVTRQMVFTPTANFNGRASFGVTVSDGVNQTTGTVNVRVTPVDDRPDMTPLTLQAVPGRPLSVPVAALVDRLIDPDGDAISFRRVVGATNGSASYNLATGMLTFIPATGFAGSASITYEVFSGGVATQGLLTVNVDTANAGRFDREIQARMANGATLDLSLAALAGPGLDVVTPGARVETLGTPAAGTLTVQGDGSLRYVAPASFTGHVVFTYRVVDHAGLTSTGEVSILVQANTAPVVTAGTASTLEDTPVVFTIASLLGNASDADGNTLSLVSAGSLSGARVVIDRVAGTVTYTPKLNATGSDRLVYGVSDGKVTTNGVIDLTILPVNDAPVARTDNLVIRPAGPITLSASTLLANDSDVEGSALSIIGVTPVSNGSVSFDAATGEIRFVPSIVSGAASFSYTVSDGEKQSIGQVWFFIDGSADLVGTEVDTPRDIQLGQLLANDPVAAGATLSVLRVEAAVNGTAELDLANGRIRFIPAAGFSGTASFRYVTSDGAQEAASTVTVFVASTSGPIVVQDDVSTMMDTALEIPAARLLGNDVSPQARPLSVVSVGDATGGVVTLSGTTIRFVPDAGSLASGSFRYTVSDGVATANGTVTVGIRENRAPVARLMIVSATEDLPLTLTFDQVLANFSDPDGRPLSISRVDAGPNGTVSVNAAARTITFLGAANFFGAAGFTVVVSDGVKETAGEVQVNVRAVDDAPVLANPLVFAATAGTPLVVSVATILSAFNDIDGGILTFGRIAGVSGGQATLDLSGQWLTVAPIAAGGQDVIVTFEYQALAGRSQAVFTVRAPAAQVAASDAVVPGSAEDAREAEVVVAAGESGETPDAEVVTASIQPVSPVNSGLANALVLPDLALPVTLPAGAMAAVSQRDHAALNTALLAGGFSLMAVSRAQQQKTASRRASDTAGEHLSPFLAGTEEDDLHTPLWDDEDESGFVHVKRHIDNREPMTPMH